MRDFQLKLELPQIITQIDHDLHLCDEKSWQKELGEVVTDPKQLLSMLNIAPDDYLQHFKARSLFPVRVPLSFIARMKQGDFDDPLLKQVMPLSKSLFLLMVILLTRFKNMTPLQKDSFINTPIGY